jgi:asparagine synthase (glutamine-hydrolysing)
MCGISGIIGRSPDPSLLQAMLHIQNHRGPNASSIFWDPDWRAGFGHNRLSILDLSAAANQPFLSGDKRFVLVFNGEIYNYIEIRNELLCDFEFHTTSDTEVLLNAWQKWGPSCLSKLNGMFGFAIWDVKEKVLFAARDRFGVKPFYYTLHEQELYFASEIKALWAAGRHRKPFEPVWSSYLTTGMYGSAGYTFWEDILELPAGHYMIVKDGKVTLHRWYCFEEEVNRQPVFQEEQPLEELYTELLLNSVALRFRSDVPVGFNLSGGLDSSALLAVVDHLFPEQTTINAFTFYTNDERYDELPWVNAMVQQTLSPLTACLLTVDDVRERVADMCNVQDEPFGGIPTLAYSRVFQEASKSVVVLLDGQGMDEAWAGYDYYTNGSGYTVQGAASSPVRPHALNDAFRAQATGLSCPKPFQDPVQNLQYRDLFYTKIPRALRFNDRVSMMYSTELREPFLDYRLVELAFAQPTQMKLRDGQRKWMLRRIASRFLGGHISQAPKRALQTPQREWLAGLLRPMVELSIDKLSDHAWFNADELRKEWAAYLHGEQDNSFYVWQWVNTAQLISN